MYPNSQKHGSVRDSKARRHRHPHRRIAGRALELALDDTVDDDHAVRQLLQLANGDHTMLVLARARVRRGSTGGRTGQAFTSRAVHYLDTAMSRVEARPQST